MRRRRDPRPAMDVDADIVILGDERLARVQTHPHAHGRAVRPRVAHERDLRVRGGCDSGRRICESYEEAVPCVSTSTPPWLVNAFRRSRRWSASTSA